MSELEHYDGSKPIILDMPIRGVPKVMIDSMRNQWLGNTIHTRHVGTIAFQGTDKEIEAAQNKYFGAAAKK